MSSHWVTIRIRSVRDGLTRVLEPYTTWSDNGWTFTVDRNAGAHTLRLAAIYQCLLSARRSRFDAEGVADVNINASSHKTWRDWKANLEPKEKLLLSMFRGGAATSPTRRANMPFNNESCPFCNAEDASMRHFWAMCPQFLSFRQETECSFNVAHGWWVLQPRITVGSHLTLTLLLIFVPSFRWWLANRVCTLCRTCNVTTVLTEFF